MAREPTRLLCSVLASLCVACGPGRLASDGGDGAVPAQLPQDLTLTISPIKQFELAWTDVAEDQQYQVLEREHPDAPFVPAGPNTFEQTVSLIVPLHRRAHASYRVRACNPWECVETEPIDVTGTLAEAIGYLKAANAESDDYFGGNVALSADGRTLVVAADHEASSAAGINGDQTDNSMDGAGASYVFTADELGVWTQQAYIKASNPDGNDRFGQAVALSDDGRTLAVAAVWEDSAAVGVGGEQADDSAWDSGAVYVYMRDEAGAWTQQAYVKASNTEANDVFGTSMALSGDGRTLAVGALREWSSATGIDGNQADNSAQDAGAVYVFTRDELGTWTQQAYVKASNTDPEDNFGGSVALSDDGRTLAVSAVWEDSSATGIDGDQTDNSAEKAGAVYVFARDELGTWAQQAYVKASNTEANDTFGKSVALSGDGSILVVGAIRESSGATGIDGARADDSVAGAGAVYVYERDEFDAWAQQAYVKASNTAYSQAFGYAVAVSEDGHTLVVSGVGEASYATGIDGDQTDNSIESAGAVYVFERDELGAWTQRAYVKPPNPGEVDQFGYAVAVSVDASTLVVGASREDGGASGIGGNPGDDSASSAGAVYVY